MRVSRSFGAIFLAFSLAFSSTYAHAWGVGLLGGATITEHKVLNSQGESIGATSSRMGYSVGAYMDFGMIWGMEIAGFITQRSSVPATIGTTPFAYTFENYELHLLPRVKILYVQVGLGGYLKYARNDRVKINSLYYLPKDAYTYQELSLNKRELGALAAMSFSFDSGIGETRIEARYLLGLEDRSSRPQGKESFTSSSIDLLIGLGF